MGAKYAIQGWDNRLLNSFNAGKSQGLWDKTYARTNYKEYFAEGVQSWFNVNRESKTANPDGVNNHVNTKEELKKYDNDLYSLISEVFPCNNEYIKRCENNRAKEMLQTLRMDCNEGTPQPQCQDTNSVCKTWADMGYCNRNAYVIQNCRSSCGKCPT